MTIPYRSTPILKSKKRERERLREGERNDIYNVSRTTYLLEVPVTDFGKSCDLKILVVGFRDAEYPSYNFIPRSLMSNRDLD